MRSRRRSRLIPRGAALPVAGWARRPIQQMATEPNDHMKTNQSTGRIGFGVGLLMLLVMAAHGQAALSTALEGYWRFEGNGSDLSGQGRDLVLEGGLGFASGLLGTALDLDASNSKSARRLVSDAPFDLAGDFTVQVWVNHRSLTREQTLIEKFTGASGPGWTLSRISSDQLQFYSGGQAVNVFGLSPNFTVGWHHIVVRREGEDLDLLLDGSVKGSTTLGAFGPSLNGLLVGKRNEGDGRNFSVDGLIDEVAIWSRALTDDDVITLYNGGAGMAIPEPHECALLAGMGLVGLATCRRWRMRLTSWTGSRRG